MNKMEEFKDILKRTWAIVVIALLILMLVYSCKARTVVKETSELKQTSNEVVKNDVVLAADTKIDTHETAEETLIEPIDASKPMKINGKEYENVKIGNSKKDKKTNESTTTLLTDKSVKEKNEALAILQAKKESEAKSMFAYFIISSIIWIVIIVLLCLLLRKEFTKNKEINNNQL